MSDTTKFQFAAGAITDEECFWLRALRLTGYENIELVRPEYRVRLVVEQVISFHILEMQTTSVVQSARALRELGSQFDFSVETGPTTIFTEGSEAQSVVLSGLQGRPRPVFVPLSRGAEARADDERLQSFLGPIVDRLAGLPESQWRAAAIEAVSAPSQPSSPWADAIGPLYSLGAMSAALNVPRDVVQKTVDSGGLLSIDSSEDDPLFPAGQLRSDGLVVRGLPWILSQLTNDIVDRYTLAAWMNSSKERLGGASVWDVLRDAESVPEDLRVVVNEFRSAAAQ